MDKILSIYKHLLKDPLSNIPSLLFLGVALFGIVTLLVSFITNILVFPFMLIAIISSFIALWYIGLLGTLTENLKKMEENIASLKSNNDRLHSELNAMQELRKHLEVYAEQNQSEFQEVLDNFHQSFKRLEEISVSNERTLLYRIAQDLEFMDNRVGMNRKEYERFIQRIPIHLQPAFQRLNDTTFDKVAGDDNKIDYKEIKELVASIIKIA